MFKIFGGVLRILNYESTKTLSSFLGAEVQTDNFKDEGDVDLQRERKMLETKRKRAERYRVHRANMTAEEHEIQKQKANTYTRERRRALYERKREHTKRVAKERRERLKLAKQNDDKSVAGPSGRRTVECDELERERRMLENKRKRTLRQRVRRANMTAEEREIKKQKVNAHNLERRRVLYEQQHEDAKRVARETMRERRKLAKQTENKSVNLRHEAFIDAD